MAIAKGWVYVLSNPALPGVLKIGLTRASPQNRCREVGRERKVAKKGRFILEWAEEFEDVVDAERGVHFMLDSCRIGGSEFFAVDLDDAKRVIADVKRLGPDWKPKDGTLVMVRRSMIKKISKRAKRFRNRFLYDWLVSNHDALYPRIGTLEHGKNFPCHYTPVLCEWRAAMGDDYEGRNVTETGLAMEWDRVKKEVAKIREFGERDVMWKIRPRSVILQQLA